MDMNKKHNNSGFGVPNAYFDRLEERLFERASLEEVLPATEGFKHPEGYFEQFENELRKKLPYEKPGIRMLHLPLRNLAYAAVMIGIIFLGVLLMSRNGKINFEQIETADIEWLLEQGALEVPEGFLLEQSESINLDELSMNSLPVNSSVLEEYLLDEIDVYEVINE